MRGSLSPPSSGPPQGRPYHRGPEGDGERDGVRGSKRLQPFNGLPEVFAFEAPWGEGIPCGCPSPGLRRG
jgi:hypothetical protein